MDERSSAEKQGGKKKRTRRKGDKYKQSELKTLLFQHIFRTMYAENVEYVPNPKIKRSDYERLPLTERMKWFYGGIVPDEEYVEPARKKLWNNTIKGLTEDMKASHLGILERMREDKDNPIIGKKMPKINEYNIRKAVEELVKDKLLLRCPAAHNQYAYYPNESLEGFRAYVRRMIDTRNKEPIRYLMQTRTMYYRRMLDRQLILDALKDCSVSFSIDIKVKDEKNQTVVFPVVGRYPKIFEMDEETEWYSNTLQDCLDCLKGSRRIFTKEQVEMMYCDGLKKDEIPDCIIENQNSVNEIESFLEGFIGYLNKSRICMQNLDAKADDGLFRQNYTVREQFIEDAGFVYRREAFWEDIILTGDDRERLKRESYSMDSGIKSKLDNELYEILLQRYPYYIEEQIVLPLLCLIELSPSVMERFFLIPETLSDQTFWLDGRDYGFNESTTAITAADEASKRIGFSIELDKLMDLALKDYLNEDTLYQTHDFLTNSGFNKTCLYRRGNLTVGDNVLPADLTFRINDGRYLSMYRSLPFDRLLPDKDDDFFKGPNGIPKKMMPTYIHGYRQKTPEWLQEMFENYVKHYCKDWWEITTTEEPLERVQTQNDMDKFIGLLRDNIHTKISLVPKNDAYEQYVGKSEMDPTD